MHSELYVGFTLIFSMDDEHNRVSHVGYKILDTRVYQVYDIGRGVFTKPHTIVVAILRCLLGH